MAPSLLAALVACPARARAFADTSQFFTNPALPHAATLSASAEGVYFTGAPRFTSLTCASCHTDGPQQVRLKLGADPASLFTDGYEPGRTYELEVSLLDEAEGLAFGGTECTEPPTRNDAYTYAQCNNNGFALEIDDAAGQPLAGDGVLCAQPPLAAGTCPPPVMTDEVLVAPDGDAVFANRPHDPAMPKLVTRNGATTWHLWWTAPAAGTGPLAIYVASVDGNGGSGTADSDQDPYGDDTVQGAFYLQEAGAPVPNRARVGCAASGGAGATPATLLVLALVMLGAWAARLRRRPG